jgi:hypothetical protein
MRPKTLAEVAQLALAGESFDRCLANFLDEFYATPCEAALVEAPLSLAGKFAEIGRVQDSYLAVGAVGAGSDLRKALRSRSLVWLVGRQDGLRSRFRPVLSASKSAPQVAGTRHAIATRSARRAGTPDIADGTQSERWLPRSISTGC